jgi:hypothetical protein
MTRHRFTFDVSFRQIVDVEVEHGTRRIRSRTAATAYLTHQLALMDWEDLLCHARELVPLDATGEDQEATVGPDQAAPHAVIVVGEPGANVRGFDFHPDDPVGRYDGFVRLGPQVVDADPRPH